MTDLGSLKNRNARVEADKAWETSWTRRLSIAAATYVIAWAYMRMGLGIQAAAWHALVPTGGYVLSTLSLGGIRTLWLTRLYRPSDPS